MGCGDGRLTERLAAGVGPEGLVSGIDASREMIAYARARVGHRARYAVCAVEELVAEAAFDAAFSCAVLHWVADLPLAISRIARALVPGGRLVMSLLAPGVLEWLSPPVARLREDARFAVYFGSDWQDPWHLRSEAEVHDLLRAHLGAAEVAVEANDAHFADRAALKGDLAAALLSPHLAILPEDLRMEFLEAVASELMPSGPAGFSFPRIVALARRSH